MSELSSNETRKLLSILSEIDQSKKPLKQKLLDVKLERNYYMQKLREIEKLGESEEWRDPSGTLEKIYAYFQSINSDKGFKV